MLSINRDDIIVCGDSVPLMLLDKHTENICLECFHYRNPCEQSFSDCDCCLCNTGKCKGSKIYDDYNSKWNTSVPSFPILVYND
jgi:hypothetical protein